MLIEEYEVIFRKYYRQIYNYCRVKLQNEQAAYDCVQEVFLVLYKKTDRIKVTDNIAIWLYRAADKVISRYIKKNFKDISLESLELPVEDKKGFTTDSYEIIDTLVSKDELLLLENYYLKGESIKSLAKKFEISEAAIYKRIERLKAKLLKYKEELL